MQKYFITLRTNETRSTPYSVPKFHILFFSHSNSSRFFETDERSPERPDPSGPSICPCGRKTVRHWVRQVF